MPRVKKVMTPFPHSVPSHASLSLARDMMSEHGIHHLPVIEDGELVGLITARDLEAALGPERDPTAADRLHVGDLHLREIVVVEMNQPLDEVLNEMANRHVGSVLVVKNRRLAGIFTASDACRLFADLLCAAFPGGDEVA